MHKCCEYCGSRIGNLLSVKHSAEILDTSQDFIRAHISKGTIDTILLKGAKGSRQSIRISAAELEKLIEYQIGLDSQVQEALSDST